MTQGEEMVLSLDALVRAIGVRRSTPFAMFLGGGRSTTSGVPSAQMCIWEWKRQIFLTNNPGLEDQFTELSLEGVRRKIQQWLDRQGCYPAEKLQRQEATLRKALIENLKSIPLIVCGYSGRDRSVMEALREAYAQDGTG